MNSPVASTLQSGVRFRAYPGPVLRAILAQWIGCQRVIYNSKVSEDHLFASQRRLVLRSDAGAEVNTPLDRQYSQFKNPELTPWLSDVPSQVLRNGCDRWWEGKQRQLKGLAKAPTFRNKRNFNSVVLTNELFRFIEHEDAQGVFHAKLELGTYCNPVGCLDFVAHREFGVPKQIIVRRTANHWWLSFSYEHTQSDFVQRDAAELAYELDLLDDDALEAATLGIDRNVKDNCVATSDGRFFALSAVQQDRLRRKAVGAVRHQKRLSRKVKGSRNQAKARKRLAAKHDYRANVARDFSHQTTNAVVRQPANSAGAPKLIGLENLKIKSMTARPKARQDDAGRWLRNGAAQKAGLNRSILASCWGSIAQQIGYKAHRINTLVLKVPAAYSSQECSSCGHTHPDNRHEQRFVCQRCGFTAHADTNAGCNVAARAVQQVRDHRVVVKPRKRVAFRRRTPTGAEGSGVSAQEPVRRDKAPAKPVQLVPSFPAGSDKMGLPRNAVNPKRQKQKYLTAKLDAPTTAPPGV